MRDVWERVWEIDIRIHAGPAYMNPPLSPKQRRGRLLLVVTIAITLLIDGLIVFLKISKVGFAPSVGSIMRWFVTAALFSAVWRGQSWARWLLVGLCGLGLALSFPSTFQTLHPLRVVIVIQLSITVIVLAFLKSVSAFLEFQRISYDRHN